ncbi:lycopene cyclase family protein [Vibrio sp. AND4]|uniref:lycopene cyclase family protein n=1 Tax=Vibrio sp. AND4 TaxID=314289 RepID=UPI00015EFC6A|nr:lycopene cyclase family protein [Vibrio sp. AND4]EDP60153.1 Lycopene beta and epsilon cyclase [Vibrio sp. AND4]
METIKTDIVMLGIGLSTCSLAMALLQQGYRGNIVMLEKERQANINKTWCFWNSEHIPPYLRHLISKRWSAWKVAETLHSVKDVDQGYSCIRGEDFFTYCISTFTRADNVTLVFDADIKETGQHGQCITACCEEYFVEAKIGFDSRYQPPSKSANNGLLQCFSGAWVKSSHPMFCDQTADLMVDIKTVGQSTEFVYVLPFDQYNALIEVTQFSPRAPCKQSLESKTLSNIETMGLTRDNIVGWEYGVLPMSADKTSFPRSKNSKIVVPSRWQSIGIRGQNIRAATGYAFISIQRNSEHLAKQIRKGTDIAPIRTPRLYYWLDNVFLRVLRYRPDIAPELFSRMAQGTSPEQFSRFMTESATISDIARVINAMPKRLFLRAAIGLDQ